MSLSGDGFTLLGSIEVPTVTGSASDVPLKVDPNTEFTAAMLASLDAGGGDLRFGSEDGLTQYPCEVVDGLDLVWVKVPSVATGNKIYVWGDKTGESQPVASSTYGSEAVWSDFRAVYHLNESPNTTAGGYADATGNGFDGTGVSMSSATVANPFGGDSAVFDGVADYISVPVSMFSPTDSDAFSALFLAKCDNLTTDQRAFSISEAGSGQDDALTIWMDAGGTGDGWVSQTKPAGSGAFNAGTFNDNDASTSWQSIATTVSASQIALYVDENTVKTETITDTATTKNVDDISIGRLVASSSTSYFDGAISELWFSLTILSSSFFAITKDNQSATGAWWIAEDVSSGVQSIQPSHITSSEAFFTPEVIRMLQEVSVSNKIATQESVYTPTLALGLVTIYPTGITSQEEVYIPTVESLLQRIVATIISSSEVVYNPEVENLLQEVLPTPINSEEVFYRPTVQGGDSITIPLLDRATWNKVAQYLRGLNFKGNDNDVIVAWLRSEGIEDQYNDMWDKYLEQNGYTGNLTDKYGKWRLDS